MSKPRSMDELEVLMRNASWEKMKPKNDIVEKSKFSPPSPLAMKIANALHYSGLRTVGIIVTLDKVDAVAAIIDAELASEIERLATIKVYETNPSNEKPRYITLGGKRVMAMAKHGRPYLEIDDAVHLLEGSRELEAASAESEKKKALADLNDAQGYSANSQKRAPHP